ncbi:hypothetical protein FRC96_07185 [Lujinxingia vulgaris]|uniref:Lipoprotein n=1 Tax=Lujinxingia vulgaris TaxID=2600176 RepID=A0A5C6XA10_9DELT|nr:hypothetical protein [Lujinxingia vulgaris]TXD38715.1 hypothetical protein FRC96_07185 [Lujinxingia vulgaris]
MTRNAMMAGMVAMGFLVGCARGATSRPDSPEPAPRQDRVAPWTLEEAVATLCDGVDGCELAQAQAVQGGRPALICAGEDDCEPGPAGQRPGSVIESLYVVTLRWSPLNTSSTCELSEVYRVDLQAREARLIARPCQEGRVVHEVKLTHGQLTEQRTSGSASNVVFDSFSYDVPAARPIERHHQEFMAEWGVARRESWNFERLSGRIDYELTCEGSAVRARESMVVDARQVSRSDAARAASRDWTRCSSPLGDERSGVRIALVNGTRLIVQWSDALPGDGQAPLPERLGELVVQLASERQSLEQTGLLCPGQQASGDKGLTTLEIPVLVEGRYEAAGLEATWHREGRRVTGVLDFSTSPEAFALRLNPSKVSPASATLPPEQKSLSTLIPADLRLVGSARARVELPCVVEHDEVRVDYDAWAAGREVQLIQPR